MKKGTEIIKSSGTPSKDHNSLEKFLGVNKKGGLEDTCIIVDSSGSMADYVGEMTKWQHLLHALQYHFEDTDAKCISFSGSAFFTEIEKPNYQGGGTSLSKAFQLCLKEPFSNLIIISDGELHDEEESIDLAKILAGNGTKGDTIYIGNDNEYGADTMRKIARILGGEQTTVDSTKGVEEMKLLTQAFAGFLPEKCIKL